MLDPKEALDVSAMLERIAGTVEEAFRVGGRVLSFEEYLALYAKDPARQGRDASRYVRDMFEHYGTEEIDAPWGKRTRYKLFDLAFEPELSQRDRLVGQEDVQAEIFRVFENFGREGRPNKLLLLHGPNGSSKSTMAMCLMRALEHYATLDEGALYRFHWVFPGAKTIKSRIGFGGEDGVGAPGTSFAHLPEDLIDAKLHNEIRDHPLFLLSVEDRKVVMANALAAAGVTEPPPEWLARGRLSHKSQQVYEALLNSYRGDMRQVLRHVSVERWFVSRRYRTGAVTLGPQMSVDAGERQITADRSLAALPAALQAVTLFEAFGELIDAAGGILEYSDLLKRPLESYKYLQLSVETGEVALQHQNVQLNVVLVGSANEVHLLALREHPEWASFRGRLELVRTPYLRSYVQELRTMTGYRRMRGEEGLGFSNRWSSRTSHRSPRSKAWPRSLLRPSSDRSLGRSAVLRWRIVRDSSGCGSCSTSKWVGVSCPSDLAWSRLTPNNSFQPTSGSSLRSSPAAAELHR